jgi:hypothetical protein
MTPEDGTEPTAIEDVARSYGLWARYRSGWTVDELRAALSRRETVIIDLQAWRDDPERDWVDDWDDGHYVVLVGMDAKNLYLMDPSTPAAYAWMPIRELDERWHDLEGLGPASRPREHMAITISGRAPLSGIPAPLERME